MSKITPHIGQKELYVTSVMPNMEQIASTPPHMKEKSFY
jgi:hypothetical protein